MRALWTRAWTLVLLATSLLAERTNVLLICVDDLRPDLGAFGVEHAHTPNLDRLVESGRTFRRHYVQVPTCGASRCALLTGRRPRLRSHLGNGAFGTIEASEKPESLPHLFRQAGYRTWSVGKVTHAATGLVPTDAGFVPELRQSWDRVVPPGGPWVGSQGPLFGYADGSVRERAKSPTTERGPADARYPDAFIADRARELLEASLEDDAPFFLAVGFCKPHLPFTAPEPYWALFDEDPPPPPPWNRAPEDVLENLTCHTSGELLGNYGSHPEGNGRNLPVQPDYAATLRQGYAAATAYVDDQIGRVLDHLDATGLSHNTTVVLWSDHGWHLGDHGVWGKHTLLERSLNSLLIVRTPEMPAPGASTWAIVESVDIYPTLAALAGLEAPEDLDGTNLAPLIQDPEATREGEAASFWSKGQTLGRSLRTDRYRFVRWTKRGRFVAEELYDHDSDPLETRNVAKEHPQIVEDLLDRLSRIAPARTFD